MPRDFPRSRRIAEQIQRELSDIVRLEMKDPRIGMITITDTEVSADHSTATVFFTLLGSGEQIERTAATLSHAAGFLRSQLAKRLRLRTVPHLQFRHDASIERGARLSRLIDEAVSSGAKEGKER
jgi:ribosome-binding factor A